jgi:uncharacterized membrane protein
MRKMMEVVGLGMLAVLYWITYSALSGVDRLPDRIPTHFDIAGQPNGWGSPSILWLLPAVATGVYLLMTILASIRFRRYNLPVPVTESNLPFIQEQTSTMVAWIKIEMICLFTYLQWSIVQAARSAEFRLSPLLIPVSLVVILSTVGWNLVAIIRGAQARLQPGAHSPDALNQLQK